MIIRIDRQGNVERDENPQVQEDLISVDMGHSLAMEYTPAVPDEKSSVAVVIMHCDQNYMSLKMGPALAAHGYHVIAADSIIGGEIEKKFELLNKYVKYLRSDASVKKIVLMGHSGGATLMTAYQAIAENGAAVFQGDNMLYKTPLNTKLESADGIMLIDANYGNGVMSLLSLDPAVIEEGNGMKLDPKFDLFDPANGYDSNGAAYSPEFIRMYQTAQAKRNERLIEKALERLEKIEKGEGCYADDEPFMITAADQPKPNNRILPEDPRLLNHTKGEYDLLHGDGSITHEQIHCVRVAEVDRCFSSTYGMGVNKNTVKGFLSSQAIRTTDGFAVTEDDVLGVDWDSSYASPIGNIQHITVPALFMGLTGSYEFLAAEMIYNHAGRIRDKTIAFIHGANHMFAPNRRAEKKPGEFGDTEKVLYGYMAGWLERFTF